MNRSFVSFVLFVCVLAIVAGIGVWWLGTGVVELAIDEDRRNKPYHLLHLADLDDAADGQYVPQLTGLVRAEEGQLVWRGGLTRLLDGRVKDEWADCMLFDFGRGGDLVQMVTSVEYRRLTQNRRFVMLGAQKPPAAVAPDEALVLWLLESRSPDAQLLLDPVVANIGRYSGSVVWDTPVDSISGAEGWDHVVMLSFPSSTQAEAWFREPLTVTERTLVGKGLASQAWLLLNSGYSSS